MSSIEESEMEFVPKNFNKNLETRRWFILIIFFVFTFTNASGFVTFSPII